MKALKSNCIFGIVIGLLIVAAGLYLAFGFSGSYIGNDSGTAEFGADFYTYQYKATRNAATNVENLGLFTRDVAQFGFRDRPIGVEPCLVLPADIGSAPLEDSGHADPLHRLETRITGRQIEVRQQVAARIEHRLLHPAHRDFGRIDARR